MKTVCLGGSFNPIHYGHTRCARAAALAGGFSRVLLVPAAQPPHKPADANLAAADHRLAMCGLAVATDHLFEVSNIETRRKRPSYTIDTARELKKQGMSTVHWLIGADMLNFLPKWREPEALLNEVNFLVMARPGYQFDWDAIGPAYAKLRANVVAVPAIDISSTEIRRRVAAGESIDGLTPPAVVEYIRTHRLYLPPMARKA